MSPRRPTPPLAEPAMPSQPSDLAPKSAGVDPEDVRDAIDAVDALSCDIAHYQEVAGAIEEEFDRLNEDRKVTLDDLPYGEELIRIDKAAEAVRDASNLLRRLDKGRLQGVRAEDALVNALAKIEDARSILVDCKDLPPDDPDDEYSLTV